MYSTRLYPLCATIALAVTLTACGGSSSGNLQPADPPPPDERGELTPGNIMVLSSTTDNDTPVFSLTSLDRTEPDAPFDTLSIEGLPDAEALLGMAYRPATGDLYALGRSGMLHVIDPVNATVISSVALTPAPDTMPQFVALEGTQFGVDFNPVPDRLRVTSDTGQNLRINVDTGATIVDGDLDSGTDDTRITSSAYTNSFAGTASTRLFNIDSGDDLLYLQQPPNDGNLVNPVSLGVNASADGGFVIDGLNNLALAALTVDGSNGLYVIDLNGTADVATLIGPLAVNGTIHGLALPPPQPPQVIALTGDNTLATFPLLMPASLNTVMVTGLMAEEALIGVDVRPATGDLYAVSDQGNIYIVDPDTGTATFQATLSAAPDDPFTMLTGTDFGMDFNPVPDRLRLISDSGQNLRINVETGATITDGDIAYAEEGDLGGIEDIPLLGPLLGIIGSILLPEDDAPVPAITAAAYTNSFAGTATTELFTLDTQNNSLNLQSPPNDGVQVPLVDTPFALQGDQGFDIAGGDNGIVIAALSENGMAPYVLYRVNLMSGDFTPVTGDVTSSTIGGADAPAIRGITVFFPAP
ncbi:DUF4394 domain-containing protein [Alcanivorax sp. JB21]|uniref:DUF4394 domain-containing protein n=1 Tax=Alcanivorax limicola TaxID=2874102 RepID=UPI001CBC2CA7|nr:DUF4394 domain-containing protein [Alcanivorax limicola]MBZ2187568.1 DUF4394 domain-containing protein [Alcanivorax limicola]